MHNPMCKWFDSHCHPHDPSYSASVDDIVHEALSRDTCMCVIGTDFATSREAADIAGRLSGCYAAVGMHPDNVVVENGVVTLTEEYDEEQFERLLDYPDIVAIGECGLDYYRLPEDSTLAKQVKVMQFDLLMKQLAFAHDQQKPVVIHCREAYDDFISILDSNPHVSEYGMIVHCFTGTPEQAEALVAHGAYIGITGIVTFPKANMLRAVVNTTPIERIVIETDSPYLTPEPYRGEVNYPHHVSKVGEKVAEIKNISVDDVARITTNNAARTYNIILPES